MKTLYFECNMGAAGDMLAAALLPLHPNPADVIDRLNQMGLPDVAVSMHTVVKHGITGTDFTVRVSGTEEESQDYHHHKHQHNLLSQEFHQGHSHHGMKEIEHILSHLKLPPAVLENVREVYGLIADAESKVHGQPVELVHFHEVGALDAVADIAAVCLLIHELSPDLIVTSPIHVGSGQVKCAHGILPVPAPATELLLQNIPSYGGSVEGELCTPTGAALLRHFSHKFGSRPLMCVRQVGYGMGKKDFEQVSCVRAFWGESIEPEGN